MGAGAGRGWRSGRKSTHKHFDSSFHFLQECSGGVLVERSWFQDFGVVADGEG